MNQDPVGVTSRRRSSCVDQSKSDGRKGIRNKRPRVEGGTSEMAHKHKQDEEDGSDLNDTTNTNQRVAAALAGDGEEGDECIDDDDSPWMEELHRAFVEAVFKVGIRQASPSVILELMRNEQKQPLTSERVKSRLQKYRNNSRKSNAEFMQEYDAWVTKALTAGRAGGAASQYADPATLLDMMGIEKPLMGGDVAALLTYACLAEDSNIRRSNGNDGKKLPGCDEPDVEEPTVGADESERTLTSAPLSIKQLREGSQEYTRCFTGSEIKLPVLTEAEKSSPLGLSITHVISLFYNMTHYVMKLRSANETNEEKGLQNDEGVQHDKPISLRASQSQEKALAGHQAPSHAAAQPQLDTDESAVSFYTKAMMDLASSAPPAHPFTKDKAAAPNLAVAAAFPGYTGTASTMHHTHYGAVSGVHRATRPGTVAASLGTSGAGSFDVTTPSARTATAQQTAHMGAKSHSNNTPAVQKDS